MKTASISQAKNQLRALIDQGRQGESIVITDHDRPAKLVPAQAEKGEEAAEVLAQLERKGIIRRGNGTTHRLAPPLKACSGTSALGALIEDREQGR